MVYRRKHYDLALRGSFFFFSFSTAIEHKLGTEKGRQEFTPRLNQTFTLHRVISASDCLPCRHWRDGAAILRKQANAFDTKITSLPLSIPALHPLAH